MRRTGRRLRGFCTLAGALLVAVLSGCGQPVPDGLELSAGIDAVHAGPPGTGFVDVQFLGVAGFVLRHANDMIMTAPMFSNPPLSKLIPFTELTFDRNAIDRFLPPVADAEAILVGHAHYDHLLDVPYIARRHARNAVVYGSATMSHTIAAALPVERRKVVNVLAARPGRPGIWLYNKKRTMRWMAIEAAHAPHLRNLTLLKGYYDRDLPRLPRTAFGYLEGQTFAWLIDFLDEAGVPRLRIYYQDSACGPPDGMLPELPEDDVRRVDVAVVGVASFANLPEHPQRLIRHLGARHYVFSHWDNFLVSPADPVEVLPGVDLAEFVRRAETVLPEDADWTLPRPLAVLRFAVPK